MTTSRRAGFALASMCLFFLACDRSPTEPSDGVGFQTVLKTSLPGLPPDLGGRETVRDRAAWQAVWSELHGQFPQPLPEIDFNREMVIVVLGPGCNGEVTVSSITGDRGALVVNAQAKSCSNTLCAIADFSLHVVRLSRFDLPVRLNVKGGGVLC